MPVFVMIGALFMTVALICYATGILMTVFTGKVKRKNVILQVLAVCFDLLGTTCMIVNSGGQLVPHEFHGWIGYIALALMVVDMVFVLRHRVDGLASTRMRIFSVCVLVLWVTSYSYGFVKM